MLDYVEKLGETLHVWCQLTSQFSVTQEYCKKLAWGGLHKTKFFQNLPENERVEILNALTNEQENTYQAKGQKCD